MSDFKYIVSFDDGSHIMTDSFFDYVVINKGDSYSGLGTFLLKVFLVAFVVVMLLALVCIAMK